MALNEQERFLAGVKFDNRYFEGYPYEKRDYFGSFWGWDCEIGKFHDHNKAWEYERVCDDDFWGLNYEQWRFNDDEDVMTNMVDVVDLLPQDPFNMNISHQVTTITGWFEDFDNFCIDEIEVAQLFAELNIFLNGAMGIHQDVGFRKLGENSCMSEIDMGDGLHESVGLMDVKMEDIDGDGGASSDAIFLSLSYLGLRDLLSVETVCKALRDVVHGDPLLWRSIHVDHPLSSKITNDILIKLTDRAQGHLYSLSLVNCSKITDSGLSCVLERNPSLRKLSVLGCGRITADGLLCNLKVFKSAGKSRLVYLGIDGLFGMTNQHFEEFKVLLAVDISNVPTTRKPRFFQGSQLSVSSDDDHAIDIEICPKCQQLRPVYDCPAEGCQKKQSTSQLCRACTICIKRCISCGRCLNDDRKFVELFCLDRLCYDCCEQEKQEGITVPLENLVLHKQASCDSVLCG